MRTWSLEQMALKEAHKNDGKEEDRQVRGLGKPR